MHETKTTLLELKDRIKRAEFYFQEGKIQERIQELENQMSDPKFWENTTQAACVSREASELKATIENWEKIEKDCTDLIELCDIIAEEHEPQERQNIIESTATLEKRLRSAEIKLFLGGKYDHADAILSIHAGTGGTDAKDFAAMLLRMYLRYAELHQFKTELLAKADEPDAGIKSATIEIQGPYAYGYLKEEKGVHRLVRLSPFNAGNTRETSFAMVEVLPRLDEDPNLELKKEDLKVDTYRSSGPGGQNVNKTDTAVRITHLPTSLVVACQSERSQIQNKERALKIIKTKLLQLMEEERAATLSELKGENKEVSWGNQIRSYVLHPYKMVKDHRTGYETSQVEKVLDAEILDEFIEYSLEKKVTSPSEKQ